MFVRRECPGVNVQIRIDLNGRHVDAAGLQKRADGRGDDAFAHAAHDTAGDQNVFHGLLFFRSKGIEKRRGRPQ